MLLLFALFSLAQTFASPTAPFESPDIYERSLTDSCHDIGQCRTIGNIILSCLATIFSCTWVAVHPNVPSPKKQHPVMKFIKNRLILLVLGLLVPEYILVWAIRQRLRAAEIVKEHEAEKWTKTQAFFFIMGGFHLFHHPSSPNALPTTPESDHLLPVHKTKSNGGIAHAANGGTFGSEDSIPIHPLSVRGFDPKLYNFIMPDEEDIRDKGKSDWLAKGLVVIQTTWFVVQCIARAAEHLPITELEIITLAYATLSFAMYIAWWDKPLNVGRPIRVYRNDGKTNVRPSRKKKDWGYIVRDSIIGDQDEGINLASEDAVPLFWSDTYIIEEGYLFTSKAGTQAAGVTLALGILFGAIHCAAWSFAFPSPNEQLLWRISAVAITAIPLLLLVSAWIYAKAASSSLLETVVKFVYIITVLLSLFLYIATRGITLVLASLELGSLKQGTFETVQWTTFIPHI